MHFSFSAVNENADENELPFSAETKKGKKYQIAHFRRRKTKTNFGRLLVCWLDLSDPDPLRFYDRAIRHWYSVLYLCDIFL